MLFYYFRNDGELKNIIDIVIPTNNIFKGNHYERNYPLTINIKYPILALTDFNKNPPRLIKDWDENIGYSKVKISYDKYRKNKILVFTKIKLLGGNKMTDLNKIDKELEKELQAEAFKFLIKHFQERTDVQNIDLMNLAGFVEIVCLDGYKMLVQKMD